MRDPYPYAFAYVLFWALVLFLRVLKVLQRFLPGFRDLR